VAPDPIAGLRGCNPGMQEMGEKERGRWDRGWEERHRGENREMGAGRERNICLILD